MYEKMFNILSEKADYKTMYGTIPLIKAIFKCRRKRTYSMHVEMLAVIFRC